jgi:hypothetical protein
VRGLAVRIGGIRAGQCCAPWPRVRHSSSLRAHSSSRRSALSTAQPARFVPGVSIPSSRNRLFGPLQVRRPGCRDRGVSIPSSRNRLFGQEGSGFTPTFRSSLNPLIEESSLRTPPMIRSMGQSGPSLNPLIEESSLRTHDQLLSARSLLVSIPSSRNRLFGRYVVQGGLCQFSWSQSPHRGIVSSDPKWAGCPNSLISLSQSPHRGIVSSDVVTRKLDT